MSNEIWMVIILVAGLAIPLHCIWGILTTNYKLRKIEREVALERWARQRKANEEK